jgi:hypothetical protein
LPPESEVAADFPFIAVALTKSGCSRRE